MKDSLSLDKQNGNIIQEDAISKEKRMPKWKSTVDIIEEGSQVPKREQFVKHQMSFNMKMDDF